MRGSVLAPQADEADATVRMPAVRHDGPGNAPTAGTPAPAFRADIQGLRAVAVGLVVLYHAGLPGLTGGFVGVDVFFVISGFLITQGLVRELEARGTVSLRSFYARRARRILPAATVTLLAVGAAAVVLLPRTQWVQIGRDLLSSAGYLVNWDLADRAVQYSARDQAASPLQHFWSLAVEEQFYLLWPLTILAVVVSVRLLRRRSGSAHLGMTRRHLWLPLALIAVPSLAWSVHLTAADPGPAYFVTTTRAWELALGAGLAVLPATAVLGGVLARVVGWAGLGLILLAATTFDGATVFPGAAALLPTLGAVAVLASGLSGAPGTQNPLLCTRPLGWVGGLSYSLYLWHWPVLVIAAGVTGEPLQTWQALALAVLSVLPAWLSLRLVEQPVLGARTLRGDDGRTLQLGALCMLIAIVAGLLLQHAVLRQGQSGAAAVPGDAAGGPSPTLGAGALAWDPSAGEPRDSFPSIVPTPVQAAVDWAPVARPECTVDQAANQTVRCSLGDRSSDTTIALVGDSHAEQFIAAVEGLAEANAWRLDVHTRGACPFAAVTVDLENADYTGCDERNAELTRTLLADPPDVVLTGTSRYLVRRDGQSLGLEESKPLMEQGFRDAWEPLVQAGIHVLSIRDLPRPDILVPDCVEQHSDRLTECAVERAPILWEDAPEVTAAEGMSGVEVMDLTPWVCPTDRCPAVIGGTIVYRDGNHLTATYSRTLAGAFGARLGNVLG